MQKVQNMQATLQEKFAFRSLEGNKIKLIFRLPSSQKLENYFLPDENVKVQFVCMKSLLAEPNNGPGRTL